MDSSSVAEGRELDSYPGPKPPHTPTPPHSLTNPLPLYLSLLLLAQIALYPPNFIIFSYIFLYNVRRNTLCLTTQIRTYTPLCSLSHKYFMLFSLCMSQSATHSSTSPVSSLSYSTLTSFPLSPLLRQRGPGPGRVAQGHVSAPLSAVSSSPLLSFTSISISPSPPEQLTSIFLSCLARCSVARVMD